MRMQTNLEELTKVRGQVKTLMKIKKVRNFQMVLNVLRKKEKKEFLNDFNKSMA